LKFSNNAYVLSFLLLYFIGKSFYNLKEQSKTGRWLYVFYGILSYIAGLLLSVFIIAIILELIESPILDDVPDRVWDLIGFPFGVLACWGLFKYLKKKNESGPTSFSDTEVLDGGLIER
jgi:hypothetical protein